AYDASMDPGSGMIINRSVVRPIAVAVAVVFALVVARWLTTPWDDWVPLEPRRDLPASVSVDDLPTAAHYRCSAVLDMDVATATDQAANAERYQELTRKPCDARTERRVLG